MRYGFLVGPILSVGLMISSSTAFAAEPSDFACHDMDAQVRTALESSQSANRDEAVRERNSAREFCNHDYYKLGTEHLAQALKLLGSEKG